jgi:hypothetical protein
MRTSFLPKDWKQNKNARYEFVTSILIGHYAKFFSNMWVYSYLFELSYSFIMITS